ncbi:pyruvate dehydrogenase (acetyl-transferring) E1 component subunit alpha [Rhabdochlamydiaceae symbiont of Dictyostelium giganteum]|uniref:pyruvate dehydrogenase (acetyl-transferring) E1 component subunit alpha n=1 Tax=Rhabdochlamydiaceae symbiont of Dictyostelium giganteum TaxID=3342349 RepID=UPI00384F7A78
MEKQPIKYHFFDSQDQEIMQLMGPKKLIQALQDMLLIRHFELRAESAYLQGKIGGFFHSYMGQEAIQTAAVHVMGDQQWWATSYRCHALALLLKAKPRELMAELFGKSTGNAKGRGGSMHLYTDQLLGGFGIVAGQVPIATGAAFSLKYLKKEGVAICFLGDGAVAQGSFHEALNIASLWNLPCIYVIENNQWGMGTAVSRAIASSPIGEKQAISYNMKSYTLDGMDFFNCYAGFSAIFEEVKSTSKPVLVEAVTERFKGHSISDPGLYRSKEMLTNCMQRDPLHLFSKKLIDSHILTEDAFKQLDQEQKKIVMDALEFAEESPWPSPIVLGEDVFSL